MAVGSGVWCAVVCVCVIWYVCGLIEKLFFPEMSPAELICVEILLQTSDGCSFVVLHDELIQVIVVVATSLMSVRA